MDPLLTGRKPWFGGGAPKGFISHRGPDGAEVYTHETAVFAGKIDVGSFTFVGAHTLLTGNRPIVIGKYCSLGPYLWCDTSEAHSLEHPSSYPLATILGVKLDYKEIIESERGVKLGSDVWIGSHVKLSARDGLDIGHGVAIGTRSLVMHDCEPYGVYVGSPARLVRFRFGDDIIAQLLALRWWDWPMAKVMANGRFFSLDLTQFEGRLTDYVVEAPAGS